MEHSRRQFMEPEIVKHGEKMADVTLQFGSGDLTDDCLTCQPPV